MKRKKKTLRDTRNWNRYQFFGVAALSPLKENAVFKVPIANISLTGLGAYSMTPIGKGKKVKLTISFIGRNGKVQQDVAEGTIDWQKKCADVYFLGILFDEELNAQNQPRLIDHLSWLIETFNWPQPYRDKRIAML